MTGPAASRTLDALSLCGSGVGGRLSPMRRVLDWFDFLGGRPGEVVYVDGGSSANTRRALTTLLDEGHIDRLELLHPANWENHPHRCYIQEHQAGRLATRDYLCFVKLDTLALREGRDDWLDQAITVLDEPQTFAITNSHLIDPMQPVEEHDDMLASDFASLNFSLMKRSAFIASMEAQISEMLRSGFRTEPPTDIGAEAGHERAMIEWAWRAHCPARGRRTLAYRESRDWMIFHINKQGSKLMQDRAAMRRRDGVEAHFDKPKGHSRPPIRGDSQFGRSIESAVRRLRGRS